MNKLEQLEKEGYTRAFIVFFTITTDNVSTENIEQTSAEKVSFTKGEFFNRKQFIKTIIDEIQLPYKFITLSIVSILEVSTKDALEYLHE